MKLIEHGTFVPLLVACTCAYGCLDLDFFDGSDTCSNYDQQWCEGGVVFTCSESVSDFDFGGYYVQEVIDCNEPGFECVEWTTSQGDDFAGCKVSDDPCPEGKEYVCVGQFIGYCATPDFPLLSMDCNPSEEFHRYCKEVDFGEEERYPDCCERSEDGIEKCN